MKICGKCKEIKELIFFGKAKQYKDGYQVLCKICYNNYRKDKYQTYKNSPKYKQTRMSYRKTHKEEAKQLSHNYYINNKEKHRAVTNAWIERNKEYFYKVRQKYYQNNKDKFKQFMKKHRLENPGLYKSYKATRRARELEALPAWADLDKIAEIYKQSCVISKKTGIKHHVDHIIPLNGKIVCGLHIETNLQIISASMNLRKSNKMEI